MATTIKRGAILPSLADSEKYFWWLRMAEINASSGTSRKLVSMDPIRLSGHSTRPATSLSSAGSSFNVSPSASASRVASAFIIRARSAASSTT